MAEVIDPKAHATIEEVNIKLLDKLEELIDAINGKDPDMVRAITESVAKLNASLKGNNIFAPKESPEERKAREEKETLEGILVK